MPKKQKNIKFELGIKLNHDTYMYRYSVSSQQVDIWGKLFLFTLCL